MKIRKSQSIVSEKKGWKALCKPAQHCKACPLWKTGTQTVFGEGSKSAKFFFIGEQPGNEEDLVGKPFVGPAGKMLHLAMEEAGILLEECYITNAVKHFKWEPKGKRRVHKKPTASEIAACKPWLEAEIGIIQPEVVICLGATAVASLLGSKVKVMRDRGKFLQSDYCKRVMVTIHPSLLLRIPDRDEAKRAYAGFVKNLKEIRNY